MMSGADIKPPKARATFGLDQHRVDIVEGAFGGVWMQFYAAGTGDAPQRLQFDAICGAGTAAELRAIADHLEGLKWG